jgi:FlaA1/EpsC-like NDP-sugar epimerase
MGEPVRIIDLAEAMIRLSGLEPERDIAVEIIGARPGEKFYEDLFNPYERPQPTPAQKILRAQRERFDPAWVERAFAEINLLVLEGDGAGLADRVAKLAHVRSSEPLSIDTVPGASAVSTASPGSPVPGVSSGRGWPPERHVD